MNKFSKAFKALGATAVVAGITLAGVQIVADSGIAHEIDSYAFNHFNKTVFQPAHEYMKDEYTAFAYRGENKDILSVKLPIIEEDIAKVEAQGTFDNPEQFKATMVELNLDRNVSEQYITKKWRNGDKLDPIADGEAIEKIKTNIKSMRNSSWDLHMPKQIGSTGTPG